MNSVSIVDNSTYLEESIGTEKKETSSSSPPPKKSVKIEESANKYYQLPPKPKKTAEIFWGKDPNILFNKDYLFEFFPVETMTYEQKLNAITRLIILLTLVGFLVSSSIRILFICAIIMFSIYLLYESQSPKSKKGDAGGSDSTEGFDTNFSTDPERNTLLPSAVGSQLMKGIAENNLPPLTTSPVEDLFREQGRQFPDQENVFDKSTTANPMANILISDYDYNPHKKPAKPAYVTGVVNEINNNTKQMILNSLPNKQTDLGKKLFSGLGDNLEFEQSMRQFVSNPATTIPNDQGAFAEFLYGGMTSSKEGNQFSLARNLTHYTLY